MLKLKIKEKIQPIKPLWNFWIYLKSIKYNFISFLKEIILFLPNIYRIKKYDQNIKKNCNFKKIKGSSKKKIHFICFSCRKHFKYLFASLKSLEKLNSKSIGNIYLSIDKKDFLTKKEINKILDLNLKITIQANKRITGMGIKSLLNELDIFEKISKNISPNDFVAKIDSDILFISDNIFKKVLKSNGILIGQKEERHGLFIYTQGGCYFLKNKIIESIINQKLYLQIMEWCFFKKHILICIF